MILKISNHAVVVSKVFTLIVQDLVRFAKLGAEFVQDRLILVVSVWQGTISIKKEINVSEFVKETALNVKKIAQ